MIAFTVRKTEPILLTLVHLMGGRGSVDAVGSQPV